MDVNLWRKETTFVFLLFLATTTKGEGITRSRAARAVCPEIPFNGGCGISFSSPPTPLQSGTASLEMIPWQSLITAIFPQSTKICGGVILDRRHVLTAASCVTYNANAPTSLGTTPLETAKVNIRVGTSNLDTNSIECHSKIFQVEKIAINSMWNPTMAPENDVALLKITGEMSFNQFVRPACLPLHNDSPYRDYSSLATSMYSSGWSSVFTKTDKLYYASTPVNQNCPTSFSNPDLGEYERYNLLCSGGSTKCVGDAGGPLMAKDGDKWRILGIFGAKIKNCQTGTAFARLAFFRDWIISEGVKEVEGEIDATCPTPKYEGDCGLTKVGWEPRSMRTLTEISRPAAIINGRRVSAGQLPWQAFIQAMNDDESSEICGGGVINKDFVLTAAHCVVKNGVKRKPSEIRVSLGEIDINKKECHEMKFEVNEIIVHQEYNGETLANDIALLRLSQSATFNDFIRPVCLAPVSHESNFDYTQLNGKLVASGWGRTNGVVEDSSSNILLATDIIVAKDCPIEEGSTTRREEPTLICSPLKVDKDTCNGDSGGILAADINGRWTAIGIVSQGSPRCDGDASYTRVSHFRSWIDAAVNSATPTGNEIKVHVETGILAEVGLYDLKAIFCVVSAHGGVTANGFQCSGSQTGNSAVPPGNLVCGGKLVISNRDYNDALVERKWDTQVRTGDSIILEAIKTALISKGLKGDEVVKCMGKSYGRESGCKILGSNPNVYLCNDKYIASEAMYQLINS